MARVINVVRASLIVLSLGAGALLTAPASALDLDAIKTNIAKYKAVPEFVPPGPAFDAKACMKDKKILTVPFASSDPLCRHRRHRNGSTRQGDWLSLRRV